MKQGMTEHAQSGPSGWMQVFKDACWVAIIISESNVVPEGIGLCVRSIALHLVQFHPEAAF